MKQTKEQVTEQFNRFHGLHPEVYEAFKHRANQLWEKGRKRYSANGICHILRFHSIIDGRPQDERKINNNFSSFYSRMYTLDYPERKDFFEQREQGAKKKKASITNP